MTEGGAPRILSTTVLAVRAMGKAALWQVTGKLLWKAIILSSKPLQEKSARYTRIRLLQALPVL